LASYRIVYWHQIPSVVEARDETGSAKEELSARFQSLIDMVAMRRKLVGTDAYLEGWRKSRSERRDGAAGDVARAVAAELEAAFDQIRAEALET
jgi:hypothetical protein